MEEGNDTLFLLFFILCLLLVKAQQERRRKQETGQMQRVVMSLLREIKDKGEFLGSGG